MATPPAPIFPQLPVTPVAGVHSANLQQNTLAQSVNTTLNQVISYLGSTSPDPTNPQSSVTSSPGFVTLPGGLILQWGLAMPGTIMFPIPFPNACYNVQCQVLYGGGDSHYTVVNAGSVTSSQFGAGNSDGSGESFYWFALGY